MIENGILQLKGYFEPWNMQIDLNELIRSTGKLETYRGPDGIYRREVLTKKPEARRVLKFALQNASLTDLEWMDVHFRENEVLNSIWVKLRRDR